MKKLRQLMLPLILLFPLVAQADLQLSGSLIQGGLIYGQVSPGTKVFYGEQPIKLTVDGLFILGFGRDAAAQQSLTLINPDGQVVTRELAIAQREYRIERINGISKKMMEPSADDLRRIRQEAEQTRQARQHDTDLRHFRDNFIWPVTGRISGVYGSQRIFNGEPRRPHFGIDIAAANGTPVNAPAGGTVRMAHEGMFFSGKTLILDHGHGLSSSFLHLERILVKPGQQVVQGEKIATVGATGRVTGPHLDWRINWFGVRLDPALLTPAMP